MCEKGTQIAFFTRRLDAIMDEDVFSTVNAAHAKVKHTFYKFAVGIRSVFESETHLVGHTLCVLFKAIIDMHLVTAALDNQSLKYCQIRTVSSFVG